jgi:tol-pal system protein YbgF
MAVLLTAGCATKRDVKELREEMVAMQARQDTLVAQLAGEIRARNREVLDSVAAQTALVSRMRGDFGRQLTSMEQQLIITQELAGQSQRHLEAWRQDIAGREQLAQRGDNESEIPPPGEPLPEAATGTAEELYAVGMDQLRRQAANTARQAFEQLLRAHPDHGRAPDAQFQIAETYELEQRWDEAFESFERVVQEYPESRRAPQALYRAGLLAENHGEDAKAREYFERLISGYPGSDEAGLARDRTSG